MTRALLPAAVFVVIASSADAGRSPTSSCDNPALAKGVYVPLDIEIPDSRFISVVAINERRDIIGTYWDAASRTQSFLLRDGVIALISAPGATSTSATDINASGTVVGTFEDGTGVHNFTWRDGRFTLFPVGSSGETLEFTSINASGVIAGGAFTLERGTVFVRRRTGATTVVDVPERQWDFAVDMNDRGDVLVLAFELLRPGWADYYLVTRQGVQPMTGCGFLNDVADTLSAVTNRREFVGRTLAFGGVSGIVYSNAGVTVYDYPGASYTDLVDMNSAGDAIGHARFGDNFLDSQPFLFVPTGR